MNKDTKIIKTICYIVGLVSFFLIAGLVGGYEKDAIGMVAFIKAEAVCNILLYVSIRVIDIMQQIEDGREMK